MAPDPQGKSPLHMVPAQALFGYFSELTTAGFTDKQALDIAIAYQRDYLMMQIAYDRSPPEAGEDWKK
jgi:hypothetical protein